MADEKRIELRRPVKCAGKLSLVGEIIDGDTINVSQHGAKIQLRHPLQIVFMVKMGNQDMEQQARVVWARPNADGEMECGLEFMEENGPEPLEDYGTMGLRW